jgi:uncharacterized protein (DUF58 family)
VTGRIALGLAVAVAGSLLAAPLVVALGLAIALVDLIRLPWRRRGLDDVEYSRRLSTDRAVVGDEIALDVSVWNRKRLPLAWLRAEDAASVGLEVRERELTSVEGVGRALVNAWTLAPYERVVRHFHLVAARRGVHQLGPVRLAVGDLLAGQAGEVARPSVDRIVVRPRVVPVAGLEPAARWGGLDRARRGLLEQPLAYAGVRDYQPGDPLRRIHQRASARLGRPVVKRFDPAREREVLVALDIQTVEGPAWMPVADDERVEELCIVVASVARRLRGDGAAVGLAVAGYAGTVRPVAILPPAASADQVPRILDLLARLAPYPSASFDRLLGTLPRVLAPGAEILLISARDPAPFLAAARRLGAMGYGVTLLAIGPGADGAADRARAARVAARVGRLDGTWADARGLAVA